MSERKVAVILDAHALIHRAFHALPPTFTNKKGESTNAVYGFTSVLLKVLRDFKPDYIAAAFDTIEPTFRDELYKEYKAHRPVTSDDLHSQIPKVKEVLQAFGITIFEKSGFEADDLVGTLASELSSKCRVVIVTGDLDTLQLVNKNVEVHTLKKGVTETAVYNEEAVAARFGITPSQMVDFKGLKGDASDNIPGVKGIGEKTASILLQKFKTLEQLYKEIENNDPKGISVSVLKKLRENKDMAFFSRKLSIIRCDVPLSYTLDSLAFAPQNKNEIIEKTFHEMGFFTLLERFQAVESPVQSTVKKKIEVFTKETVKKFKSEAVVVVMPRFNKEEEYEGVMISYEKGSTFFLEKTDVALAKEIFEDSQIKKIGHNLKKLWHILDNQGIVLNGLSFDVMLASYLLSPGRRDYPLERIIFQIFGSAVSEISSEEEINYIWKLEEALKKRLKEIDVESVFYDIEMPLVRVLAEMEKAGIMVQQERLQKLAEETTETIDKLEKKIYQLAGEPFNVNSPQQLKKILFDTLQLKIKGLRKTAGGTISTQASELIKLKGQHEIIDLILEHREVAKLKNTYIDPLPTLINPKTGRLHTTFNSAGAATGRLSSSDPNMQNIPIGSILAQEIRSSFVAEENYRLVSLDYSQIELRIAAALASDKKMLSAFNEGKDIHTLTASEIFNVSLKEVTSDMRRTAKVLNFGVLYGMGSRGVAEAAGIQKDKASQFIEEYFNDFSGVAGYIEEIKDEARRNGFVRTLTGRRRYLPEIHASNNMLVAQAERMAVNMPIQGTAADIMKLAMIKVYEFIQKNNLNNSIRMLLTVHDELLFEARKDISGNIISEIKKVMENVMKLPVPIVVDMKEGDNWGSMKKI